MPRKHPKTEKRTVRSWAEADAALLELGRLQARLAAIKDGLGRFAKRRRADFGGDLSRRLNHGRLGWKTRTTRRVEAPEETAELLREAGREEAVTVAFDWRALGDLSAEDLARFGVEVRVGERFFCEPAGPLPPARKGRDEPPGR